MQNYELMKDFEYIIVPCQVSLCDYVEGSSDSPKLEKWEHERLVHQRKEFTDANKWEPIIFGDELEENTVVYTNDIEEPMTENRSEWRKYKFEDDIIIDANDMLNSSEYAMIQLSYENGQRNTPKEGEKFSIPLKFLKPLRRTVLDLYPVSVKQNATFIKMDPSLFPINPQESDSMSDSLQKASGPIKIRNGEIKNRINLDFGFNISLSSEKGRIFLYETSEQHSPYRMQPGLSSLLAAYSNNSPTGNCPLGVWKQIKRISPFFGGLSDNISQQLALENKYFRVPVYQHSVKSTDFLLIFSEGRCRIRRIDGILLAGKQMPLKRIYHPKSPFFHDMMMRVIVQLFADNQRVPVDVLATIVSNVDFLNIESDLHKFAQLTSDKKFWILKPEQNAILNKNFHGKVKIDDYMIWAAIYSYLTSYDYIQSDKRLKKKEKKKEHKNSSSPWSISKSYLNGIKRGFWKLGNFENPTGKNQMDSFLYVKSLVPKTIISKTDLRKLTVYQTQKLLQKFEFSGKNLKNTNKRRWDLVNQLSTLAATDLKGNVDMEKYARETKPNRRLLRKKYIQQCKEMFERNSKILSNPTEAESEKELHDDILKAESKEITIEDFRKYLKETNDNSKNDILPVIANQENAKKILENPLKYFAIYRKKDGIVKKEVFPVTEYVLTYLKHAKSGRFGKKLYGLGDLAKREKQQLRDKLRRQEKYKKKRLEMNLPVEFDSQDTTDKVCSSCGRKGHIRTNQECPNFGNPSELIKQESTNSTKSIKSSSKAKILKVDSIVSDNQIETPIQGTSGKQIPIKRNAKQPAEKMNPTKRFKIDPTDFRNPFNKDPTSFESSYDEYDRGAQFQGTSEKQIQIKRNKKQPNEKKNPTAFTNQRTYPFIHNQATLEPSFDDIAEEDSDFLEFPLSKSKEKKYKKNYKSKEIDDEFPMNSAKKRKKLYTKKSEKQSFCPTAVATQKISKINSVAPSPGSSTDPEFDVMFPEDAVKKFFEKMSQKNEKPKQIDHELPTNSTKSRKRKTRRTEKQSFCHAIAGPENVPVIFQKDDTVIFQKDDTTDNEFDVIFPEDVVKKYSIPNNPVDDYVVEEEDEGEEDEDEFNT